MLLVSKCKRGFSSFKWHQSCLGTTQTDLSSVDNVRTKLKTKNKNVQNVGQFSPFYSIKTEQKKDFGCWFMEGKPSWVICILGVPLWVLTKVNSLIDSANTSNHCYEPTTTFNPHTFLLQLTSQVPYTMLLCFNKHWLTKWKRKKTN